MTTQTSVAPAPSRATASGVLSWGMVVIPIQFFAGVEDQTVARTEWVQTADGTFAKVGRVPAVKNDDGTYGEQVSYSDIIKRYQTDNGSLVELTDAEIGDALDLPDGLAEIVAFQPVGVLNAGAYLPESVMQVRGARRGEAAQVALDLLFKAMRKRSVFALVRYVIRGNMRFGALLANGRFLTLRFDNEVRAALPVPTFQHSADELAAAVQLIDSRTVADRLPLTNDAADRVRAYAETKADDTIAVHPIHARPSAQPLLDALAASIAANRMETNQ